MESGVLNLVQEIGTKYIISSVTSRIDRVMQEASETGKVIDLAGAKFNPVVVSYIERSPLYKKVEFINSEDKTADEILKNNRKVILAEYAEYPELNLGSFDTFDDITNYIVKHRRMIGEHYKLITTEFSTKHAAIGALLVMALPNVDFDLRSCSRHIFTFVRKQWCASAKHHDAYYETVPPNTRVVRQTEGLYDGMEEEWFVDRKLVLPYEFGTKELVSFDGNVGVDEEWQDVAYDIFMAIASKDDINELINTDATESKTLISYLTLRKE